MKRIKLLHNCSAGDEGHAKDDLIKTIEKQGYTCEYANVKEPGWDEFDDDTDLLAIAGGDGTVRKVVKKLLRRSLLDKQFPLAIIPLGTANNLAKSFSFDMDIKNAVRAWKRSTVQKIDIGKLSGVEEDFFMESFGLGIFPGLMKKMKKVADTEPENEVETAIKVLHSMINSYPAKYCRLHVDGIDHSGHYLLVEIMNIRSIGPNLVLAPKADPTDGLCEVILIGDPERNDLMTYVEKKIMGTGATFRTKRLTGHEIELGWEGNDAHADDKLLDIKEGQEIKITMYRQVIQFLSEDHLHHTNGG